MVVSMFLISFLSLDVDRPDRRPVDEYILESALGVQICAQVSVVRSSSSLYCNTPDVGTYVRDRYTGACAGPVLLKKTSINQ